MLKALLSEAKPKEYKGDENLKESETKKTPMEVDNREIDNKSLADFRNVVKEQMELIKSIPYETLKMKNEQIEGKSLTRMKESNQDQSETKESTLTELIDEYIKQLKAVSPCPETIDAPDMTDLEKQPPEEVKRKRSEFNRLREQLIKDWEEKNGREWPTYKEDVYDKNGNVVRKAGSKLEAHHIKPLSLGGENSSENITPLEYKDHNDHKGVHASDSPYSRITSTVKENQ